MTGEVLHKAAGDYQIMPPLSDDEFESLKSDIAKNGVLVPVEYDEHGSVLDGHHRVRACRELGITTWPRMIRKGMSEAEKRSHARALNLARRHLTKDQRAELWVEMRKDGMSYRQIAEADGTVSKSTVADTLNATVQNRTVDLPQTVTGKDGKKRAAAKPKPVYLAEDDVKKAEKLPETHKAAVLAGDMKPAHAAADAREQAAKKRLQQSPTEMPPGLFVGDFREYAKQIPDESIELIFTDPPYDRDSIPLFGDLAEIAARVLRPGGSLIAYCGQIQLPDVLRLISAHLRYWWVNACIHSERPNQMNKYGIKNDWKPMVWFVKGSRGDVQTFVTDAVSGKREKSHHDWQQAQSEAEYYIERLCSKNGIVWEPFGGGGTTIAACQSLGRKWIACELDEMSAANIAQRVSA